MGLVHIDDATDDLIQSKVQMDIKAHGHIVFLGQPLAL
jgi:hypothetical protein